MSVSARRVQMSRKRGWRKPANTFYVGRPGRFGNPFSVEEHGNEHAIELYEKWIQAPAQAALLTVARIALRGKSLGCWCKPGVPCHAAVLLRLVND